MGGPANWLFAGENDAFAGFTCNISRQILIRQENDFVAIERIHHFDSVAAGAANIGFGLHIGVSVDVGDDWHTRILRLELAHIFGCDAFGQRTTGAFSRNQHHFAGVENFGGLSHETHSTEHDDVFVGHGGFAAQFERIANIVGDAVKERWLHIVVSQNDGIALNF